MDYAKLYNLKVSVRATDHLRLVDDGMPVRHLHVQSILEHEALTAKLIESVWWRYGVRLQAAGEDIDPVWASFVGSHHDDAEWKTGDTVPSLGYKGFTHELKAAAEADADEDLYGLEPSIFRKAREEYEERKTSVAKLVKLGDVQELFGHNRVLLCFGQGVVTFGNYRLCAPETREESLEFLLGSETGATSIAEILEGRYIRRFKEMNFPPIYQEIFDELTVAVRFFPFEAYIRMGR